jgi:hypothetical protein
MQPAVTAGETVCESQRRRDCAGTVTVAGMGFGRCVLLRWGVGRW